MRYGRQYDEYIRLCNRYALLGFCCTFWAAQCSHLSRKTSRATACIKKRKSM